MKNVVRLTLVIDYIEHFFSISILINNCRKTGI